MSSKSDDAQVLEPLAREGGRFKWSRLTYRVIKAANRLIRQERARIDKDVGGGWDLS